jgi:hypothetical protein
MTVNDAINLLNGTIQNSLTAVLRVMLMNAIQDAARRGDEAAMQFIEVCALNVTTATKH